MIQGCTLTGSVVLGFAGDGYVCSGWNDDEETHETSMGIQDNQTVRG